MRGGYEADTLWPTATAPQTLTCNRETKRCNRSDLKVVSCTTQQVGQLWSERPHRWRVFFLLENGILRLKITFFFRCAGHIWAAPSSGARNTYIDPEGGAPKRRFFERKFAQTRPFISVTLPPTPRLGSRPRPQIWDPSQVHKVSPPHSPRMCMDQCHTNPLKRALSGAVGVHGGSTLSGNARALKKPCEWAPRPMFITSRDGGPFHSMHPWQRTDP